MNPYLITILLALISIYVIETLADYLNLQTLTQELPEEFKGVFDDEQYAKSQRYTKTRTHFGFVSSAFGMGILFLFWFLGGFQFLDQWVRDLNVPVLIQGLLFIGILYVGNELLSFPFQIYSTFVIEQKFGFNKTTPKTFVLDKVKVYLLTILLGGPLLAGILAFFQGTGSWAWVWCWGATTFFGLFVQFIAPHWIMPLFNKFTPLEEGELRQAIFDYAKSVQFPLKNIFVIDGSRRSSKTNAFFTGFGENKRIALFDTLVEKHSVPELVSVLAHEIGHYKKKHIVKGMIFSFLQYGLLFYLMSIFISHQGLFDAFQVSNISVYAGLIFFSILYSPLSFIFSMVHNIFSRHNEFEADRYSVETTKKRDPMVKALKTLSVSNLSHLTPHPFYVFLKYSHPPVPNRVKAIRAVPLGD